MSRDRPIIEHAVMRHAVIDLADVLADIRFLTPR
jgi:hypothetical protein